MQANWTLPPDELILNINQVDIWLVSTKASLDTVQQAESSLSADETQRAAKFRFEKDRIRFVISHVALRDVLSRYLHIEPREISFTVGEYGRPSVGSIQNLDFNLSHSGDYALIAIARGRKVGVDVECFRDELEIEKIARRFFSQNENDELMSLPPDQQQIGFFNCWTRKEAYIKAHGLGLSLPLDGFDVSLSPNEPAKLRATRPNAHEASRWTLLALETDSRHAGAVAVEGRELEFRFWDWTLIGD
ncbi:MAG: 4'-phosphopantetheinyl transferase superfamily protein [Anaerolineales bacterium]|nr:4'-phosphopantetheinyl transferase superfamily protein [Anaerolineales bacterium]